MSASPVSFKAGSITEANPDLIIQVNRELDGQQGWYEGRVINVLDNGTLRVRSVDHAKSVWSVKPDEDVYDEGEVIEVAEAVDTTDDALVESEVTSDDGWKVEVLDDGSRITTSPTGRQFFTVAPTTLAPNGLPAESSYRSRGVQQTGFIARVWKDGIEDTSGTFQCAVCGDETSVQKFPTKNSELRLNVHRKCNSDRLAAAKGVRRPRQSMAN